ncbi:Rha family transcriptional regulator [Trabulsiella odontotermitis]|uniref:DNA-binding protein n=1 Tax=Trabulsiella odontotermitis TaxID=379893 RepID=A0A0L0GZ21_9ENTR|nr:Rha family transcriptional regulator [Trabulsiella odontotermitis]KNC94009.1 DNA-binding protein [Trabulsiella odontotermitis]
MNNLITNKPSMTSLEISELVGKRHDNVKRTIETLASRGVIQLPQIEEVENKQSNSPNRFADGYRFEGESGKRDSIVVVAQLSPEFTARLVDRWRELEEANARPALTEIEMIAAMAADAVRQQKRLTHVEAKVEEVAETIENIKRGSVPAGWSGYTVLKIKCGMTKFKCQTLVKAYGIPTDTITMMTPDGQPRPMGIVEDAPFMAAFRHMMSEAEQRGTRWYHPKMNLFNAVGWAG